MTLTTLIVLNTVLTLSLVSSLVALLAHGVHSDRRHRTLRASEIRSLPEHRRDRIAA